MADQRITQLVELGKSAVSQNDVLPVADISASETKKITVKNLIAAGIDLVEDSEIDISKIDQNSVTKLGSGAIATNAITGAKLADNSSIFASTVEPSTDNFVGRGFFNTGNGYLEVFNGSSYQFVTVPPDSFPANSINGSVIQNASITFTQLADNSVVNSKIADGAVSSAKLANEAVISEKLATYSVTSNKYALGSIETNAIANGAVTYSKIQPTSVSDVILGRSTALGGTLEEIPCTAAARSFLAASSVVDQRDALELGSLALASGTWVEGSSFSGISSGTNTGDQTISLIGAVTGSGTGTFTTTLAESAVAEINLATSSVTSGKIATGSVTADKLAGNSTVVVNSGAPVGSGSYVGQRWLNTANAQEYTWTGSVWLQQAGITSIGIIESTPISLVVSYPDPYTAVMTADLDAQGANTVWAGPLSGEAAAPSFRSLVSGDLPVATAVDPGAIKPGTGLTIPVDGTGTLNHVNSVTGATVSGITFDSEGHISAAVPLQQSDIPPLDASKIAEGFVNVDRIEGKSITRNKLADYATASLGETLPVADFIGQIFLNPLDKAFFMWDGNVWVPIGISAGQIVFAGAYDASTNTVSSVTADGTGIGLVVGDPLPLAGPANTSYYVVVAESGTGISPAPAVALAPPDIILSTGAGWIEIDVSDTYVAQSAANISFSPAAQIGSTNVQNALEEVSNECRNASNITSGTLAAARGGTGLTAYTKGELLVGNVSNALGGLTVGTDNHVLYADSTQALGVRWGSLPASIGSVSSTTAALTVVNPTTTPSLAIRTATTSVNGIVQLSDSVAITSSVLAATSTAVKTAFDVGNAALPRAGGTMTGDLAFGQNAGIVYEGGVVDTFQTRIFVAEPTTDHSILFPDATGTLALTSQLDDGTF